MSAATAITAALRKYGRPMTLRRYPNPDGTGTPKDVTVYGYSPDSAPSAGPGVIVQTGKTMVIGNAEIAALPWPGPEVDVPRGGDRLIDGAVTNTIERGGVDTKYLGPQILAHFCLVKG